MFFEKKTSADSINQIISGLGSLMGGGQNNQGLDLSMMSSILNVLGTMNNAASQASHNKRSQNHKDEQGIDWGNIINMGSTFFQQSANSDMVMGLVPMVLQALGHGSDDNDAGGHDHSGHSWFLPPILENMHVMWDHFR